MCEVQLCWHRGRGGAALGLKAPTGSQGPARLPECQNRSSDGRGGRRALRCQRRLRQAGGVRLRASPRSHLPPSRESPRAWPRERQYARAALPSTAGGGGDAAGGGPGRALGGAGGDPAARPLRCPGAAAASALAAWGTSLGGVPGATHRAPLPGVLFAKAGAAPFCRALRAAVTRLDPASSSGPEQAPSGWTLVHPSLEADPRIR